VSPQAKFLRVRPAYLDNNEQGVLNDIGEIHLEVSAIFSYIHIVLRPRADLDGLHHSEHTGYMVGPLSPGKLPPDPTS